MKQRRKYKEKTKSLFCKIPLSIYPEINRYINFELNKLDVSKNSQKKQTELENEYNYNKNIIIEFYQKHYKENTLESILIILKHQNNKLTKKFIKTTILNHIN